jgi:hypothetical protein
VSPQLVGEALVLVAVGVYGVTEVRHGMRMTPVDALRTVN